MTEAYPAVLKDLADQVAELLIARGMALEEAAEVGFGTAEFIRQYWGGQKIYIPKAQAYDISRRDVEIFAKWNGRNFLEICREYKITHTRLYQIIQAVRRARRGPAPEQPELFKEAAK